MKKSGFTLIELLTLIIILAIIALIATPIFFNVIESNKKKTAELSIKMIERAADLYYFNNQNIAFKGTSFICQNGSCKNKLGDVLDISGTTPNSGTISIDAKGNIVLTDLLFDNYNCNKADDIIYCGLISNFENSNTIVINEPNPINYRIYGAPGGVGNYNLVSTKSESTGSGDVCDGHNCLYYISNSKKYNSFTIDVNGQVTSKGASLVGFFVDIEPNTTYTSSFNITATNGSMAMRIREFSDVPTSFEDNNFIKQTFNEAYVSKTGTQYKTFTTSENTEYVLFTVWMPSAGFEVNELQLVPGEVQQPYVPYGIYRIPLNIKNGTEEKSYNIDLPSPLSCNEDVCDYIDYSTGKVYRKDGIIENMALPDIVLFEEKSTIGLGLIEAPSKFVVYY